MTDGKPKNILYVYIMTPEEFEEEYKKENK